MPSESQPSATNVQQLFAGIARRYDLLNDVLSLGLHRYWKHRLVKIAVSPSADSQSRPTLRCLDLCCGTGDIARRFAGQVVGVDFTAEMLRVAADVRRRSASLPQRLQFVQADALRLPFVDNSFDVVSVGYGLRNLADLDDGLREVYRVLRPSGQFVSLDFGKPSNALWRRLYFAHLRFWVPVLGWLLAGNRAAYAYILPSLERYPGQRGVQAALERGGFCECGFEEFIGGAMAVNWGRRPSGV